MFEPILVVDVGCDGAMFVGRIGSSGPEAVCPPYRWFHRRRAQYDRHKDVIHHQLRFLIQEWRPRVLAFEEATSVMGRRHVGVSQAWMGAEFSMVAGGCPQPPEIIIRVPGQHGANRTNGWAVMRASFAEIMPANEMRELGRNEKGQPGEHVTDGCAIFLRAVAQWEEMRRGLRRAAR